MRKLISLLLILAAFITGGIGVAQERKQNPQLPPSPEKQANQRAGQLLGKLTGKGEHVNASVEATRHCYCQIWVATGTVVCCTCYSQSGVAGTACVHSN